ncbi:MAG TPA: GGDEF domain-containing protein [Rubrobacteraceae bacterium]|nr:GGDEF domain-containing protein [Rubrobacteraceae bacterium]
MKPRPGRQQREDGISGDEQAHLVVLQGPSFGDVYYLDEDSLVLGSNPFRADIVVRDIEVEPEHARISHAPDGGYVLKDLGTGEPTIVNEDAIEEERPLSCGDRITLGDSVLEFIEQDPIKGEFHRKIQRLINQDYLTGLLAKNRFDDKFEQSLEFCEDEGYPLSVLMADIDNLKKINDTYGHLLGEFVVGEIGRIIQKSLHSEELYATRFGGDEYQAILPRLTKEEAMNVAEEIRRNVEEYVFEREGVFANPTISFGAASYPEDGATRDVLTEAADEALYRAKRAGGNTVCK